MRASVSFRFGSFVDIGALLGVLALIMVPGCGGDEPVSNTNSSQDNSEEDGVDAGAPQGAASGDQSGPAASSTSSATSSPSTTPGSTDPNQATGTAVGIACDQDSDCLSPLTCVREDESFRGSFPGTGVCTMPCTSDEQCQAVDSFGFCDLVGAPTDEALAAAGTDQIPEGMAPYCLQACPFGLGVYKCDSLATSSCTPIEAEVVTATDGSQFQFGLCLPICSGDSDCQSGQECDSAWGLCVEAKREGLPVGEKCDPENAGGDCESGICLSISADLPYGICTAPCNVHADTIVCGGEPGPDAKFGCFSNLFTELQSSINDLGQCLALCDADEDCPDALACDLRAATSLPDVYGRSGVCFPTSESVAAAVDALGGNGADAGASTSTAEDPTSTASSGDAG